MSDRSARLSGRFRGLLLGLATMAASLAVAADARAMCCVCRDCSGAAFCVDGVANALVCSQFCVAAGCPSTVFDSVDACAGGCDGAPEAPTATASATPSETPTLTPTGTATDTATPTDSATATATGPPQLSGRATYSHGGGAVPDASVAMVGDTPATAISDGTGDYGFPIAGPGSIALQPQKQGQFNAAVTSLDATYVLQAVAGTRTLTTDEQRAADVTGNGTFSTLDAVFILQFQAGLLDRFAAADACGSDWLFVPVASPTPNQTLVSPQLVNGICQPGRISLTSFTPPLSGRDFRAILLGDVTGNWTP